MEEGYTSMPSSRLLGSVPAVIPDQDKGPGATESTNSNAKMQNFPPNNGGYQPPGRPGSGSPYDTEEQTTTNWRGFFSVASYQPYFNVDTDIVVDRIISSIYPMDDFYRKIDANPDMYGPIWITTTLVFILAAFGNCATYLTHQRSGQDTVWNFDVTYVNWAATVLYGYTLAVPAAFYFMLQYLGPNNASLVKLWCMWGYSLSIFIPTCLQIIAKYLNLKVNAEGSNDLMVFVISASVLQLALAIAMKVLFFV